MAAPAARPARLAANVLVALALVSVGVRVGGLRSLQILSINMSPTLHPADRVLVRGFGRPDAGDVVVYRTPFSGEAVQIGRVVALPGQTVELSADGLLVDGRPVETRDCAGAAAGESDRFAGDGENDEERPREPAPTEVSPAEACPPDPQLSAVERIGARRFVAHRTGGFSQLLFPRRTVTDGHLFVLNDNRIDERDSRIYGAIPFEAVVGVATFVYYAEDEHGIRWDRMTRRVS